MRIDQNFYNIPSRLGNIPKLTVESRIVQTIHTDLSNANDGAGGSPGPTILHIIVAMPDGKRKKIRLHMTALEAKALGEELTIHAHLSKNERRG